MSTQGERDIRKRLEAAGFSHVYGGSLFMTGGIEELPDGTFVVRVAGDPMEGQNPGKSEPKEACSADGLDYVRQDSFSGSMVASYIVRAS